MLLRPPCPISDFACISTVFPFPIFPFPPTVLPHFQFRFHFNGIPFSDFPISARRVDRFSRCVHQMRFSIFRFHHFPFPVLLPIQRYSIASIASILSVSDFPPFSGLRISFASRQTDVRTDQKFLGESESASEPRRFFAAKKHFD